MRPYPHIFTVALLLFAGAQTASADSWSDTREVFENAGESEAFFAKSYGYAPL